MKLTWHMYVPPYHFQFPKQWGREWRVVEDVSRYRPNNAMKLQKFSLKMSQKPSFFLPIFDHFLIVQWKTVTYLMHYLVLHHWSKLKKKLTIYLGELSRARKSTKMQPKMMLSAVAETFANWKLRNKSDVNETYMTYVYTTLTNFISKTMRVWMKSRRGRKQISTKKCY